MVVKIINSCFNEYEKKSQISTFALKFDYNILKQGKIYLVNHSASDIIFMNDHSLCVSKLLWLYYKNGHNMMMEHFHEFVLDIYRTKFYRLFFHWSWQIRNMFYYFTLFILNHRIKNLIMPKKRSKRRSSNADLNNDDYYEIVKILYILLY